VPIWTKHLVNKGRRQMAVADSVCQRSIPLVQGYQYNIRKQKPPNIQTCRRIPMYAKQG